MTRPTFLFGSCLLLFVAGCTTGLRFPSAPGDSGTHTPGDNADAAVVDSGGPGGGLVPTPDASLPDAGACAGSCAPDDCGEVPDGCGGFLHCSDCPEGQICGAAGRNKCGMAPSAVCVPRSAAELCAGKCGAVSDGCSGVVLCGAANGGVSCKQTQLCVDARCQDSGASCSPLSCAQKGHQCGVDGDGCGGALSCGGCDTGKQCVYAPTGNTCQTVAPVTCTPRSAATACAGTCGIVGDGCGNQIDCQATPATACPQNTTCGGSGQPGVCGSGQSCSALPIASVCAGKCGVQADGCGGTYQCDNSNGGQTCDVANGELCGGGGVASQCGKVACSPKTQAQACPGSGASQSCGVQPDGCGNLIDCGTCPQDQSCGLYTASICGALPVCQPTSIAVACAGKCGSVPDGCGGVYQCNGTNGGVTCSGSEYCGANSTPNTCGAPLVSCVAKTCAQLGHSCGLASDGCGHVIDCWPGCGSNVSCTGSCGNGSACLADSTTGVQSCVAGAPSCSGSLCASLPTGCAAGSQTTLTGTVRTPGRLLNGAYVDQLPVPNALVYIPADTSVSLPDIMQGVVDGNTASCGRCADEKLVADGVSLLAAAVSDYKGDFVLQGRIPVGTAFKLVIKVGKWRRVVLVPAQIAASCATRSLALDYTRLAASPSDGLTGTHLPQIAVSTGDVDAMECVLRGIGIADSEFTVPSGTGHVHMYRANGTRMYGTTCTGTYRSGFNTVSCSANSNAGCVNGRTGCAWNDLSVQDTTLYASQAAIDAYDMVVFDCEGSGHYIRSASPLSRLLSYANDGGRVFASHWSYEWLANNGSLGQASAWATSATNDSSGTGYVSLPSGPTSRSGANPVKSLLYRDWLDWQGALTGTVAGTLTHPGTPQLALTDPRDVAGATVGAATDEWMYRTTTGPFVQQLSFNTPYAASDAQICGRVAFSAFHVAASSGGTTLSTNNLGFPAECHTSPLTAQEKTLAFMLFDLGTCVSAGDPPQPPACKAKTAADICPNANDACGYVSDGCGGVVDCAGCDPGYYCDGNLCRPQQCTPATCASLGYNCGSFADGCGGIARNSQGVEGCGVCSGGQICGLSSPGICGGCVHIPLATACPSNACGSASDGCGGIYNCGACSSGFCGGGGANLCGPGSCVPAAPATACGQKNCGYVADGCGGSVSCGSCTAPDTCGGAGVPNVCGHPVCTPKTLQQACNGLSCGWVSDGCGGAINCGTCPNGGVCGGAGPNECGASCTPTSCSAAGAQCGNIGDQCGGLINCGPCPTGQTCGAAGANKCGSGPSCTPRSCSAAGASCGLIGDGCGNAIDCGACVAPQTCGGAGVPNQCGTGTSGCNKLTCGAQSVQCGAASDGCGGLLDCGVCPSGSYCQNGVCNVSPG